jgi:hypothetical protein
LAAQEEYLARKKDVIIMNGGMLFSESELRYVACDIFNTGWNYFQTPQFKIPVGKTNLCTRMSNVAIVNTLPFKSRAFQFSF